MSPRAITAKRGSRSALPYDGGAGGRSVTEPLAWLQDDWMGRRHGFIEAPAVTAPDLISVKPRPGVQLGAAPCNGPPRPEGLIPGERRTYLACAMPRPPRPGSPTPQATSATGFPACSAPPSPRGLVLQPRNTSRGLWPQAKENHRWTLMGGLGVNESSV